MEYYHPKNGKLVRLTRHTQIAKFYGKRWFMLDLLSVGGRDERAGEYSRRMEGAVQGGVLRG